MGADKTSRARYEYFGHVLMPAPDPLDLAGQHEQKRGNRHEAEEGLEDVKHRGRPRYQPKSYQPNRYQPNRYQPKRY